MGPVEATVGEMTLQVQVAYSPSPEQVDLVTVSVPAGATVADALKASGLLERHGLALDASTACGVWSKMRPLDHPIREGDRVEVYRPLRVDPKEARRQRYRKTGTKGKGTGKGTEGPSV